MPAVLPVPTNSFMRVGMRASRDAFMPAASGSFRSIENGPAAGAREQLRIRAITVFIVIIAPLLPSDLQDHSKTRLAAHHAVVRFCGAVERVRFDQWPHSADLAEPE